MNRVRGFTLIEIAVALFIIALLGAALAQYLTGQISTAKQAITQTRQASIKAALINFIARNSRVPCPAIATTPSGAPLDGLEAPAPGACTGTVNATAPLVATGMIPWASLGLPGDAAIDGYGNRFTYQVTLAATNLTAQTVMGMKGEITVHSAGLGISVGSPSATPAGNQLNDCRPDLAVAYVSSANPCAAVAVIVSHGPDGYGAYIDTGVALGFPAAVTGSDAPENSNINAATTDSKFVMKAFSGVASNPFDDIVLPLTANDLIGGLTNTGGMQSALATVNANFNVIKSALIANAFQNRTGLCLGTGCFATANCPGPQTCEISSYTILVDTGSVVPPALALPANVTNDLWGTPIKYVRTTATFTSATTASDTAFTLTSAGPDALFGSADDIITTISVGEVRTQFSKY